MWIVRIHSLSCCSCLAVVALFGQVEFPVRFTAFHRFSSGGQNESQPFFACHFKVFLKGTKCLDCDPLWCFVFQFRLITHRPKGGCVKTQWLVWD